MRISETLGLMHEARRGFRQRLFHTRLMCDVETVMAKDPASPNLAYALTHQGLHAIWLYRAAHLLHQRRRRLLARGVAYLARVVTGIDLHPGAELGSGVFIDHGCGVVIGETAVLEDDVMLYHNVTVGSVGWWHPKVVEGRRHPVIQQGSVLCTGALILGPVVVGRDCVVGANAVVLADLPGHSQLSPGTVWRGNSPQRATEQVTLPRNSLGEVL